MDSVHYHIRKQCIIARLMFNSPDNVYAKLKGWVKFNVNGTVVWDEETLQLQDLVVLTTGLIAIKKEFNQGKYGDFLKYIQRHPLEVKIGK